MARLLRILLVVIALYAIRYTLYDLYAQDKIVAIVNNEAITQKDLDDFINFMRVQLSQEYAGQELESKIQSMKLDLLDRLIEDKIILQEAKKNNIKIDEFRVKARLAEIKKNYGSDTEFQNAISRQGLTQADIELKARDQLLTYNIVEMKVKSKIIVNPAEVTDFYQKNSAEFKTPEERRVTLITIDDENLANDIYNKLKESQDPESIASEYSLKVNKLSFKKNKELKKEIEDVVFKLNTGEISPPIKINNSFYIFRLDDIVVSRQQNLSEVQEQIYAFLFNMKMQEVLTKWLDELKGQAYIKIMQD